MGEVWVADQASPLQRRVAVKVIRPGLDSERMLARFDQERQAALALAIRGLDQPPTFLCRGNNGSYRLTEASLQWANCRASQLPSSEQLSRFQSTSSPLTERWRKPFQRGYCAISATKGLSQLGESSLVPTQSL